MKKILYILCCFIFAGSCLSASVEKSETFVVGTTSGYAPYVSLSPKGEYEGFDIDVANLLAKKLGRRLIIKDLGNMPGLMIRLKQKKIDALIWAVSITEDRMKTMEVIYYQGEKVTEMPLIFLDKVPEGISSFADFARAGLSKICVEAGTYQEDVLQKVPSISLKYLDKIADVILDIRYGKSQGAAVDPSLVPGIVAKYPEIKVLNVPLPLNEHSLGNGICISKDNRELADKVRQAVLELTEEGTIRDLEKKWGLTGEKP